MVYNTSGTKRKSSSQYRKLRGRAYNRNDKRPKKGTVEIIHAAIVNRLLRFMRPELSNLSWVSHHRIAQDLGLDKYTVKYHLLAAVLIGEIRIRYTKPTTAHLQTSGRYPHYTEYTKGKTFTQLLMTEPDQQGRARHKRLNYYTIQDCHTLEAVEAYPDWMVEVIRLCASQKAKSIKQAKEIAEAHKLPEPERRKPVDKNCWRKYIKPKLNKDEPVQIITETPPQTAINEGADPLVSPPEQLPQTAINEGVRPLEPRLFLQKDDATEERVALQSSGERKESEKKSEKKNGERKTTGRSPEEYKAWVAGLRAKYLAAIAAKEESNTGSVPAAGAAGETAGIACSDPTALCGSKYNDNTESGDGCSPVAESVQFGGEFKYSNNTEDGCPSAYPQVGARNSSLSSNNQVPAERLLPRARWNNPGRS